MKVITTPEIQSEVDKVVTNDIKSTGYTRGFNGWHQHCTYTHTNSEKSETTLKISDSVGGCGMQQIYGWLDHYSHKKSEVKYCLIKLLQDLHYGVGLVICQVGQDFFNSELTKAFEEYGFTYDEYNNYQHGKGYRQRLYKLIITKE